jgi:hypothetical protein
MSEKINWTLNVQVVEGPKTSASDTITVDAYDKIRVTVGVGASESKVVEVQPGPAGRVQFLLIKSSQYGDALTYKVNNAGNAIKLDAPQLLIGDGAVGLLGASPPTTLGFTNNLAQDANIEVLVGRKAIAPPSPPP